LEDADGREDLSAHSLARWLALSTSDGAQDENSMRRGKRKRKEALAIFHRE